MLLCANPAFILRAYTASTPNSALTVREWSAIEPNHAVVGLAELTACR
jgi:hypothetical protein